MDTTNNYYLCPIGEQPDIETHLRNLYKEMKKELTERGRAIIDVVLFTQSNKAIKLKALLDTGSRESFLSDKFKDFDFVQTLYTHPCVHLNNQIVTRDLYQSNIKIPAISDLINIFYFCFIGHNYENDYDNIDLIIGTRFMDYLDFKYNNPYKQFSLEYHISV